MKKSRFIKSAVLEELRSQIPENLPIYRTGSFDNLATDPAYWFEYDIQIDETALATLHPSDGQEYEVKNCQTLYKSLSGISAYEARDERFWTYLSHTDLLIHARKRWPIPDDDEKAVSHIKSHFFASDSRGVERDNVGSRLWWIAHLCARVDSISQEQALEAFLYRSDVRASIIERPTTSQCSQLFNSIVCKLSASYAGSKLLFERLTFRTFMKEINSIGGYKLLDCLPKGQIEEILDDIITIKLKLSTI